PPPFAAHVPARRPERVIRPPEVSPASIVCLPKYARVRERDGDGSPTDAMEVTRDRRRLPAVGRRHAWMLEPARYMTAPPAPPTAATPSRGFEIFAFPCNQFGGQELGIDKENVQIACMPSI
uniref:Uncharacterized protein n=1 Tax=Triticum urartu TaxID=4572 RepID=A0A8R7TIV0_TRIUA